MFRAGVSFIATAVCITHPTSFESTQNHVKDVP